jgi:hypothetical protein
LLNVVDHRRANARSFTVGVMLEGIDRNVALAAANVLLWLLPGRLYALLFRATRTVPRAFTAARLRNDA